MEIKLKTTFWEQEHWQEKVYKVTYVILIAFGMKILFKNFLIIQIMSNIIIIGICFLTLLTYNSWEKKQYELRKKNIKSN